MATDPLKFPKYGKLSIRSTEGLQVKLVQLLENIVLPAKMVLALNTVTIFHIRDQMEVSTDSFTLTIIMIL